MSEKARGEHPIRRHHDIEQPAGPLEDAEPAVGIFWFVLDAAGSRGMLAQGCRLADAEPYGDCLTFPDGHYEVWTHWRRIGPPDRALARTVGETEYDEWPRGRIVFDRAIDRFIIYVDRRITSQDLTGRIVEHFRLPKDRVIIRHDQHYISPRSIRASA